MTGRYAADLGRLSSSSSSATFVLGPMQLTRRSCHTHAIKTVSTTTTAMAVSLIRALPYSAKSIQPRARTSPSVRFSSTACYQLWKGSSKLTIAHNLSLPGETHSQ